jgi:hypothetical protein
MRVFEEAGKIMGWGIDLDSIEVERKGREGVDFDNGI